jgi:hypothetical protein
MREELIKSWLRRGFCGFIFDVGHGTGSFWFRIGGSGGGKIDPTSADGDEPTFSRRFPDAEPRAVQGWWPGLPG